MTQLLPAYSNSVFHIGIETLYCLYFMEAASAFVLEKNKISHQVILYAIEVALMKKIVQSILCIGSCIYIYMLLKGGML